MTSSGAKTRAASQRRPSTASAARARSQALSSMARQPPEADSESPRELMASPPTPDRASGGGVADRLAGLVTLDLSAMRREWRRLYRTEPPRLSRDLMTRALAHRIQEIAFGGLSKATLRRLAGLAAEFESDGRIATQSQPRIKPGARLVREWHGRTHSVIATRGGSPVRGENLSIADPHRPGDHRRGVVRTQVLRTCQGGQRLRRN